MGNIPTNSNNLKQFYLEVGGQNIDGTYPIGNFTTDSIEICHSKFWQLQFSLVGNNADSTVTVQQSADGTAWDDLANTTNIPISSSVTVESNYFSGRYMRVVHNSTSTGGNIKIILTQKG
jgi:hypothetical protein